MLGCNSYEVVDLGVMVSLDRILAEAAERKADIIGVSGLITPSLDEMVLVAKEMERRGLKTPLLIGGATTSKQHTAVKVAPEYSGATVHVLDASRVVDVVSSLLSDRMRDNFVATERADQERLRVQYGTRREKPLLSLEAARANHLTTEWDTLDIPVPWFVGKRFAEPALADLVPYIDWQFFFSAWELKGRFPAILDDPTIGSAARELYDHARDILGRIIKEKRITPRGVYGFWPANAVGDDIVVYKDDARRTKLATFSMLRQQETIADKRPNRSLADFVAPKESMAPDYIGAFAVTAGIGADALVKEYEAKGDDYSAIIVKALADRLAEAFAEHLHAQARKDWGYGKDEALSERRSDRREVPRHPAGVRVSRVSGPHREAEAVRAAGRAGDRHHADRDLRDVARGVGERPLLQPSASEVLQRRPHRPRPARGLRHAEGHQRRGGGEGAGAEPVGR